MGAVAVLLLVLAVVGLAAVVFYRLKPGSSHGTAGFGAWPGVMAGTLRQLEAGMVLGRADGGKLAGWKEEGHWLLIAPTGAGKSTGVLAPSIANWDGPLLAVDIKGELARACAPALCQAGVECLRIDPYDVLRDHLEITKVGIDPIRQATDSAAPTDGYRALAEMLIDPPEGAAAAHWSEAARTVVTGLVAACSVARKERNASLQRVQRLALEGWDGIRLLAQLEATPAVQAVLDPAVRLLQGAGRNERGAILSTISRQTGFLANDQVAATLAGSWDLRHLVSGKRQVALFLVLPPEYLDVQSRFLRVVVGCLVQAMLAAGASRKRRLLFVLDEAAALGRLEAVERGVSLFRGFGAHFLLSFQDLGQLRSAYGEEMSNSIRANCHSLYWACRDPATCEAVSAALGEHTTLARSREFKGLPLDGAGATSAREIGRRLLTADEVRRLPASTMLALPAGARPVRLGLLEPGAPELGAAVRLN